MGIPATPYKQWDTRKIDAQESRVPNDIQLDCVNCTLYLYLQFQPGSPNQKAMCLFNSCYLLRMILCLSCLGNEWMKNLMKFEKLLCIMFAWPIIVPLSFSQQIFSRCLAALLSFSEIARFTDTQVGSSRKSSTSF